MFTINDDLSIYLTRGDIAFFRFMAEEDGKPYVFVPNDVVRFKVTERKNCEKVVMQKKFLIEEETDHVDILLTENDTKIGDVISKPTDFWYEVELNPFTNPQTVIGYDEVGPKILKLFPEANDIIPVAPEEIPPVDSELSLTSERPIQNQAVARALIEYEERVALAEQRIDDYASDAEQAFEEAIDAEADKAIERVNASSKTAKNDADRAESAAERAEEAAGRAEAVADLKIDTELNKDSYNPIANRIVAEALENFLPKTGGRLNSGTHNPLNLENLTSDTVRLRFSGASGNLGYIGAEGKGKFVVISSEDWASRDILHTGNMADHVLPKTGGTIANATNIPLIISNTTEGATQTRIPLQAGGVNLGAFAFNGVDKPAVVLTGGFIKNLIHEGNVGDYALPKNGSGTVKKITFKDVDNAGDGYITKNHSASTDYGIAINDYDASGKRAVLRVMAKYNRLDFIDNSNTQQTVLHTGNSAKVHIGTTAPSDTSALWVY